MKTFADDRAGAARRPLCCCASMRWRLQLCSVAIPGETVVLVNGRPATLADAAEQAGRPRPRRL
ncbi:MAG: hypothetical protein ACLRZH_13740 [Ruthenibacterium lactatiformans]